MIYLRKADSQGHIVIPAEIRKILKIEANETLMLSVDSCCKKILLEKVKPICCSCGAEKSLLKLPSENFICENCYHSATKIKDGSC